MKKATDTTVQINRSKKRFKNLMSNRALDFLFGDKK